LPGASVETSLDTARMSACATSPWVVVLLLCGAVHAAAGTYPVRPLAVQQTRYEMRVGESVQIAAPQETLDFLLAAKSLRVALDGDIDGANSSGLVVGPNRARDGVLLAAPLRINPGEYTAKLSATSEAGEERVTPLAIVVKPMQKVPSGSTRPPVVLLNGWETGFTGTCTISSNSSETFGNLAQYLVSDGVPVVYFFDNCAIDANQTIEQLGVDLGTYLTTQIKYDNGDQVPQIDLVAFSMGGLIARAYLAGLQTSGTATPPATTLVRDLILIATPNFGSFVAGNYATTLSASPGTQDAELVPASSFLWNLATWNQRGDDLRGVNALAIAGNAGPYLPSLEATTQLNNASDGLVTLTSAAAGFALPDTNPTQVVPYCHVDPSTFTNTIFGTFNCSDPGIANVTSETQETGEIVRSFLKGTTDWQSVGVASTQDPYLSTNGGIFFAMEDQNGSYVTDLTAVAWGTVPLTNGGDTNTVFYTDFVSGTGEYQATSTSQGTIDCGTLTEALGYFSAARCKRDTAIFDVGPLNCGPGRIVSSGAAITITGNDFGDQCQSCQVLAVPVGSSTQTALTVSSWTNTSISAMLPASLSGLLTIEVKAAPGTDAITIMAAAPGTITGVSNAASFQPGFASATWMAICGSNLAASTQAWGASDFVNGMLPTSLDGISVTINGIAAYVEYISPMQINVLAPDDTTTGAVQIQVTAAGQKSNSFAAQKQQYAPAFFTFDNKYVAAQHADYSYVGAPGLIAGATFTPAKPGEIVLMYGTGFGPTDPATPTSQQVTTAAPLPVNSVQITIGGVAATVDFAGIPVGLSGVYQFNVTVPSSLPNGDAAVVATIGGIQTPSGVSITVQ